MTSREEAAVLFANDAFYLAMSAGDFPTLERLWARSASVTCIHPGGSVLTGRAAVMASWEAIFRGTSTRGIACAQAHAWVNGAVGVVTCYEGLGGAWLAATNVFALEGTAWCMIHHQAGPTSGRPEIDSPDGGQQRRN